LYEHKTVEGDSYLRKIKFGHLFILELTLSAPIVRCFAVGHFDVESLLSGSVA